MFRAIDAVRFVLRNPRVGLLIVGNGPAKSEFQKRTKILGIENQVIFDNNVSDLVPYLKSADVLLVTDTDDEADEVVLQGAAAGIPLVIASNERREDLFENNVSALLCDPLETQSFTAATNDLLNNVGKRNIMAEYAQDMIRQKFHSSAETYKNAYRTSIEETIFVPTTVKGDQS